MIYLSKLIGLETQLKKRFSDKTIWNAKYEFMIIYYQKRNLPNDQQSTL